MTKDELGTVVTDELYIDLLEFLKNRLQGVTSRIPLYQLCKEFKSKTKSSRTVDCLAKRCSYFREKLHRIESVDIHTRVRILYVLNGFINDDFLNKLKKVADVQLDQSKRIVSYKKKGGGLELGGEGSKRGVRMGNSRRRTIAQCKLTDVRNNSEVITTRSGRRSIKRKTISFDESLNSSREEPKAKRISRGNPYSLKTSKTKYDENPVNSASTVKIWSETDNNNNDKSNEIIAPSPVEVLEGPTTDGIINEPGPDLILLENESCFTDVIEYKPETVMNNSNVQSEYHNQLQEYYSGPINNDRFRQETVPVQALNTFNREPFPENRQIEMKPLASYSDLQPASSSIACEFLEDRKISLEKHKRFLESIQGMITTLCLPIRRKYQKRIEDTITKIEVFENGDQIVTSDDVRFAVASCISIVTKSAKSLPVNEDSASLRDILLFLRMTILSMSSSGLYDLEQRLKRIIDEDNSTRDKRIPMDKIQSALGTIIDIVAP